MVKKYPKTIQDLELKREKVQLSEIKFFELADDLNDDWFVWHSVEWEDDSKMKIGEADFLLFHPEYGFVVIEVKGGIISFESDVFYSVNQRTSQKYKIKDPFFQARKSAFFFLDHYKKVARMQKNPHELLVAKGKGDEFPLSFNYGVFFPDSYFKEALSKNTDSIRTPLYKIFDKSDCDKQEQWRAADYELKRQSPLEKFLMSLLDVYKAKRTFRSRIKDFFPRIISPKVATVYRIGQYLDEKGKELEELNLCQDYLLNTLENKKKCLFKGSAGTGKTFIAMKRAIMNYKMNLTTLFLCFNRELNDYIRKYLMDKLNIDYDTFSKKITVCTVISFLINLVKKFVRNNEQGKLIQLITDFNFIGPINEIKKNLDKEVILKFDSIIIDEAQDIDEKFWEIIPFFLKSAEDSFFYIFYDPEQAIFVKKIILEQIGFEDKRDLLILSKNLRNCTRIAQWLKGKTSLGIYKEYSGIEGFEVKEYQQFENQSAALKELLKEARKNLLNAGVSNDRMAILSYYKLENLFLTNIAKNEYCDYLELNIKNKKGNPIGKFFIVEPKSIKDMKKIEDFFKRKNTDIANKIYIILFETITSFKGLEKDIIFLLLPNLAKFRQSYPKRYENLMMQVYVGASRAKFKLHAYEYRI